MHRLYLLWESSAALTSLKVLTSYFLAQSSCFLTLFATNLHTADLNIKDFDISEILAFVKDTSTAAGKILAFERELESEAQTGSLELAEKALKLAVDISAATSDSLHRIMVSHLLNLFHTQLNLVGLKNIPATQLRDYFKQLMLVIPTDEEDVDEDIAVFMTLSKGTDPVHGLEFGPFDVKFLAVSVFGITGKSPPLFSQCHIILLLIFRRYMGVYGTCPITHHCNG